MSKLMAVSATVVFALASSAIAYTYTCQEGHFQIDVPEGAEVSAPYGSFLMGEYLSLTPTIDAKCVDIDGSDWQIHVTWSTNTKDFQYFSLAEYHDGYVKSLNDPHSIDKYIDRGEATRLNVDTGFILRSERDSCCWSIFIKGKRVFDLSGTWGEKGMNDVIRIFNSFRALD